MCIRDSFLTWAGGGSIPGVENNLQWSDYFNVDLRISKTFKLMGVNLQVFADISNLFDYKSVSYTHLRAHETVLDLVCRLLLEKKKLINSTP